MLLNTVITDVYFAKIPQNASIGTVKSKIRQKEIDFATCDEVKQEKYFIWKLLCYALKESFDIDEENANLVKQSHGGWSAGDIFVSLSHSDHMLAVAVSASPVGIDVERVRRLHSKSIAERIMTEKELLSFYASETEEREMRLFEIWTAKEAIFKTKGLNAFIPRECDTLSAQLKTDSMVIDSEKYVWTLASDNINTARILPIVDLENICARDL